MGKFFKLASYIKKVSRAEYAKEHPMKNILNILDDSVNNTTTSTYYKNNAGQPKIYINDKLPIEHSRDTLRHELVHYIRDKKPTLGFRLIDSNNKIKRAIGIFIEELAAQRGAAKRMPAMKDKYTYPIKAGLKELIGKKIRFKILRKFLK